MPELMTGLLLFRVVLVYSIVHAHTHLFELKGRASGEGCVERGRRDCDKEVHVVGA